MTYLDRSWGARSDHATAMLVKNLFPRNLVGQQLDAVTMYCLAGESFPEIAAELNISLDKATALIKMGINSINVYMKRMHNEGVFKEGCGRRPMSLVQPEDDEPSV